MPKFAGSSVRDPQRAIATKTNPSSQSLQWRTSPVVAPPTQPASDSQAKVASRSAQSIAAQNQPAPEEQAPTQHSQRALPTAVVIAAAAPSLDQPAIRPAGLHSPGNVSANQVRGTVRQTQFQLPSGAAAPQPIPDALQTPPATDSPLPDFFTDPFGDQPAQRQPNADPAAPALPPAAAPPAMAPQIQLPELPPAVIETPETTNELRQPTQPLPQPAVPQPVPIVPEVSEEAMELQPAPPAQVPPRREIEDFQMPRRDEDRRPPSQLGAGSEDISLVRPVAYSCDDFRRSIADATIQKVSLDISPPFRPDVIEYDEFQKMKQRFDDQQEVRDWQSIDGRKLGRGRLRDLAYEKVIIETEFGTTEELPVMRISEADLAYVSAQWGLPKECLIDQPQFQPRQWEPSKITWKASNLIHKPLYFEEVNLERYGHTAGPILQPVVSSAHFFANIAVLPYKMGVHLPNECQYALGYYRPGDCAPWITQPVPLSLRGALFQAGAVAGAVALIP
ncbi:MAG TPA: hypothetical protein DDZ51_19240 [Planctomycetaceae bacterium]|nr:hypothetical protein [Planctomycetaceae bacterium]